jgi:Domain of unknown function (DUF4268)
MNTKLGKLIKINPRTYWEDEAKEFTPWLASPDNMAILGETLDMDLEIVQTERQVGPFRADILCKDTSDDHWVLIENQLERTDHTHLGQLITYAAGLEAVTIIWIAKRFSVEHKSALDWLNRNTKDSITFFGLEIELWKIDDSFPAPKFNLVSKPDDWARTVKRSTGSGNNIPKAKQLQLEFWTEFRKYLEDNESHLHSQKPLPQHWTIFSIGRSYFYIVSTINTRENKVEVYLCVAGADAKKNFKVLISQKDEIEKEFGPGLNWRELPNKKESQIRIFKEGNVINKENWPELNVWLKATIEKFHKIFSKRIKAI